MLLGHRREGAQTLPDVSRCGYLLFSTSDSSIMQKFFTKVHFQRNLIRHTYFESCFSVLMRNLGNGPRSSEVITLITCHILRGSISNLCGKCSLARWTLQGGIAKP